MENEPLQPGRFNAALPYLVWTIAFTSMAGSLFFSEVMDLPPCSLCWYQRVAIYPLVLVVGTGIVLRDAGWRKYSLPLIVAGLAISVYHNLLYYGLIAETLSPCAEGVPCNARQLELFGFITIPLLGLGAFLLLALLTALYRPSKERS